MKATYLQSLRLAALLWAVGAAVGMAAEAAAPQPVVPVPADSRAGARAPEKGKPAVSAEVQKILKERAALEEQYKNATEAQKKEILQKMESQRQELLAAQRAMARQIKEDARKNLAPAINGK